MPTPSLAIHILAIHLIFLAHQIQGDQFLLSNEETENQHVFGPGDDKYKVYFAAHTTSAGSFYGLVLTMDVYGYKLINGQVSTTKIIISNREGDPKSDVDAIWVGWHVFPEKYGDSRTRFFTLWTRDAYRSTGCYNMGCPGFDPASGSGFAPGAIIDPVSYVKGPLQKLTIKMFLDRDTGDWWVHAGFNGSTTLVGRFPAKLFDTLSKKATHIGLGGVAEGGGDAPAPPMGSGYFPSDRSASITDISYIGEDGRLTPFALNTMKLETLSSCYSVTPIVDAKFSYGGPGGCRRRNH